MPAYSTAAMTADYLTWRGRITVIANQPKSEVEAAAPTTENDMPAVQVIQAVISAIHANVQDDVAYCNALVETLNRNDAINLKAETAFNPGVLAALVTLAQTIKTAADRIAGNECQTADRLAYIADILGVTIRDINEHGTLAETIQDFAAMRHAISAIQEVQSDILSGIYA